MARSKLKTDQIDALSEFLADLGNVEEIQIGGLDPKNLAKLDNLISTGRDFTSTQGEMQKTVQRFIKALFVGGKIPTRQQIDDAIEEAIVKVISLRLRTGGGDVKGSFRSLSPDYARWKRKKYPNSKGIGWATGELAHEWAESGNVIVVRR